jgi:hypothetical protein
VFRRNISLPSTGLKRKPSKKLAEAGRKIVKLAQLAACFCWFLLGLLFKHEDGSGMFLQNVGLSPEYWVLQSRRPYSMPQLSSSMHISAYCLKKALVLFIFLLICHTSFHQLTKMVLDLKDITSK